MKKELAEWASVYLKDSLMPNTILTLMYNIIKVKRRDTLNEVQTMSLCTINSAGLPVVFHIKHSKYIKIKTQVINCSKIVCSWFGYWPSPLKWRSGKCWWMKVFFLKSGGFLLYYFPSCSIHTWKTIKVSGCSTKVNVKKGLFLIRLYSLQCDTSWSNVTWNITSSIQQTAEGEKAIQILSLRPSFKGNTTFICIWARNTNR